jgi:hypothetical protein
MSRSTTLISAASILGLTITARAQLATFDSLPEGLTATTFTDGGITFSNLDRRIPGEAVPAPFAIDTIGDGSFEGLPYSPPNVLGFGGYSAGPGVYFYGFGSFEMSTGAPAGSVSLELFDSGSQPRNVIHLEAFLNGQSVGASDVSIPRDLYFHHFTLAISGVTFDRLRLSAGPQDNSVILAVIDNVQIGPVVQPCGVDIDGNGGVDVQDFLAFLQLYSAADDRADFNSDRAVNIQDFLAFLGAFAAGC